MADPNGQITFYKNVKLNKDYTNVLHPDIVSNYFSSQASVVATINNNVYTRVSDNTIRVEVPSIGPGWLNIYECNYLKIVNPNYENRPFYAFIDKVTYINDAVAEITYDIDVMTTYFAYDFNKYSAIKNNMVFVERCMDLPEGNTLNNFNAEPISGTEQICVGYESTNFGNNWSVVLAISSDAESGTAATSKTSGVLQGCTYWAFTNVDVLNAYLDSVEDAGLTDSIIAMFYMPTELSTISEGLPSPKAVNVSKPSSTYKNLKTRAYPFQYIECYTGSANSIYKYELFSGDATTPCTFNVQGMLSPSGNLSVFPVNYNGFTEENTVEKMVVKDLPLVSYSVDTFKVWLAQNKINIVENFAGNMISGGAKGIEGGPAGVAIGAAAGALKSTFDIASAQLQHPPQVRNAGGEDIDVARGKKDVYFRKMAYRDSELNAIDDFFSVYGYTQNIPLRLGNVMERRSLYNYVKTRDYSHEGSSPGNVTSKINSILNNGVTFWRDSTKLGDYSDANMNANKS